ncbi:MAG: helix-turn-helix domain-containing protein [Thermodesulfobacteriota bacterium]
MPKKSNLICPDVFANQGLANRELSSSLPDTGRHGTKKKSKPISLSDYPDLMTVSQVAEALQMHPQRIKRKWMAILEVVDLKIPGSKGTRVRITRRSLEAFLTNNIRVKKEGLGS